MERHPTTIQLTIDTCMKCPYAKRFKTWSDVEDCFDYFYGVSSNDEFLSMKEIATEIMWHEDMPNVPEWCPIRIN